MDRINLILQSISLIKTTIFAQKFYALKQYRK